MASLAPALGLAASTSATAASSAADDPACQAARAAQESAVELFARGCDTLDDQYGAIDDSGARNDEPGRIASKNMGLIANRPKTGPFATPDGAPGAAQLDYANSDLAFKGKYAFAGNFQGFMIWDVSTPSQPEAVTQLVCPGGQGDVSIYRNLLVYSVDSPRTDDTCESQASNTANPTAWEGLRIFNIKDPENPKYVAAVRTDCGSHTNSLAPSQDGKTLYSYVSSYSPSDTNVNCQPPHDKISVVKIPLGKAADSAVVSTPVLFPEGGNPGSNGSANTTGCHDITTYPSKDIAAGACMGDGILMDISDRENPVVTEQVRDTTNFAFWHSATWNNEGTKVVFTDELGGGVGATCNPEVGSKRGANGIYNVNKDGELVFKAYYKMPRTQTNEENCVAHNGSLIPVEGRDIMVQAWYQGGISVFDFTRSRKPVELAWFDRGPLDEPGTPAFPVGSVGGSWSAYWHNGKVFSNDIALGFDVLDVNLPLLDEAKKVRQGTNNPQAQTSY
ncbi:LVIVD repeat-containing protein [Nocardioides sp. CFH 31398]|uniref:LVIVD repeat-containing protein n=1 Tax=Nocardioides sp. CFH 31398 TaxID=2919579 RepID=UPI001F0509B5|nr:hypothetical protein [Nocardioides sp. CFH 31398]MCH1866105.1 hypothetical protein [Nocardioides sp. CFH 31398]